MDNRKGLIFLVSTVVASFAAISILWATQLKHMPEIHLSPGSAQFNAQSAMAYTAALARGYPDRVTGTATSRRAARFIAGEFAKLGYGTRFHRFEMWLHGRRVAGENVIAQPRSAAAVLIMAHYDTATTTHQGAEDDASGIGTILELARVFRGRSDRVAFAATDAEEWGMIGARHISESGWAPSEAAISIDNVKSGVARGLAFSTSGQFSGYTPIALRALMTASAKRETGTVELPHGLSEWVERAVELSFEDQGPFLNRRIQAINIQTVPADLASARARYHTPGDTFANFDASSFETVGRCVERAALTLLASGRLSPEDGFALSSSTYIPDVALRAMQIFALLPLIAAWILVLGARRSTPTLARDLLGLLLRMLPPALAVPALYGFKAYNVLPRYELDPATTRDPFLYHPSALVGLTLAAIILLGYTLVAKFDPRTTPFSKAALILWLVPVCVAAFIINAFGMWLYLGLFAYASLLFTTARGTSALAFNLTLLLLSALPFAAILWFFANEIYLGPYILWYLVLQAAYGVWSPPVVFVALFALVIWAEFMRLALGTALTASRAADVGRLPGLRQAIRRSGIKPDKWNF